MEATCSSEFPLIFNGQCGDIFQNTELFITTAAKTSNPTENCYIREYTSFKLW
jgi:hypothetical protein